MSTARLALALLTLLTSVAVAAPSIEVIELRSRSAEEMIPLIQPFAEPGTSLTGTGYQLIIKAEPAQMIQLQGLVHQLDTPLRNLLITVRQVTRAEARESEIGASGKVGSGDSSEVDLRLRVGDERLSRDGSYRVRTIEGREAFVLVGQRVPYRSGYGRYGRAIDYQLVSSGFYVTPHLRGDSVELEISPREERLQRDASGTVATRSVSTVVRGALGEWIDLGSADERIEAEGRDIATRESGTGGQDYVTQLRVDLLR